MAKARRISRSTTIAAPPEELFELLTNPARHPELDGSGSVRGAVEDPGRVGPGDRFRMRMRIVVPYRITMRVVEHDEPHLIAWKGPTGQVWRWELEPVDGGTRVTETFDYSGIVYTPTVLELTGFARKNARGIEATLAGLRERFGTPD